MKLTPIFKSKLGLFSIQIIILSLSIWSSEYTFFIDFDGGLLAERQFAIQILANFVMYDFNLNMLFFYIMWIIVALIPVFVLIEIKKVVTMNLITFFFPNFFFYVFLSRYSPNYFSNFIGSLTIRTLILGSTIVVFTILTALLIKVIKRFQKEEIEQDLSDIEDQGKSKCPYCGTEFNSKPLYCYKCNSKLIPDLEDKGEIND